MTDAPAVSYATTADGLRIAHSTHGDGPPLVYVRGMNSHAQRTWTDAWTRQHHLALAHVFTVTLFDARGNGMSDPVTSIDLDLLVEDVRAVVDDIGADRVTIYGQGFGSPIALAYAAAHPDRVDRLLLFCAYARGAEIYVPDFFIETMRADARAASALLGQATYPEDSNLPKRLVTPAGLHVTPETAILYLELARTVDVGESLPRIPAPTLVMHPERSPIIPVHLGKEVAAAVPDARFVGIPSASYNPWGTDSIEPSLIAISGFTGRTISLMPPPEHMVVLVTDLVGSTEMTHRVGEEHARELLRVHDAIVRDAVADQRGRLIKHTGDGMMVTFTDAAAAIDCALGIQARLAARNEAEPTDPVFVRIGIACGDVVVERSDLFGTTVVEAVRITDHASAGEVLVSDAVRAGSEGHTFGAARTVELRGFPQPATVYDARTS